jgi:hypothetical protein
MSGWRDGEAAARSRLLALLARRRGPLEEVSLALALGCGRRRHERKGQYRPSSERTDRANGNALPRSGRMSEPRSVARVVSASREGS